MVIEGCIQNAKAHDYAWALIKLVALKASYRCFASLGSKWFELGFSARPWR